MGHLISSRLLPFLACRLLPAVCSMSLAAGAVMLLVLPVRLALRRAPRICSYVLWLVVLFRLLCPVSLSAGFSLLGLLDIPSETVAGPVTAAVSLPSDMVPTPSPYVVLPGSGEAGTETLPRGEEDTLEASAVLAAEVWLAGMGLMAAYAAVSLLRLRRRLVGAVPLARRVYLADHIRTPFVLGLVRPGIYLPSALPEGERDYVLLHERCHIRRLDHVVKLLAFLALCVHWFNPLAWLFFVLLGRDMEMSCDEAVLKKLGGEVRADYSASLLRLATGRRIIAGTPLAFGEGDTRGRVKNVLNWKKPRPWQAALAAAAVIAAGVVCIPNAGVRSTVKIRQAGSGVEVSMTLQEPIRSYAVYEEIYEDGRLLSGKPVMCSGFGEDDWGKGPCRWTFTLWAEGTLLPNGGFSGEMKTKWSEKRGAVTAARTVLLPKDAYTGMGTVAGADGGEGSLFGTSHFLEAGDEVILCSVLFSDGPEGALCFRRAGESLEEANDTVVRYRLVTSGETAEVFQAIPAQLGQDRRGR